MFRRSKLVSSPIRKNADCLAAEPCRIILIARWAGENFCRSIGRNVKRPPAQKQGLRFFDLRETIAFKFRYVYHAAKFRVEIVSLPARGQRERHLNVTAKE